MSLLYKENVKASFRETKYLKRNILRCIAHLSHQDTSPSQSNVTQIQPTKSKSVPSQPDIPQIVVDINSLSHRASTPLLFRHFLCLLLRRQHNVGTLSFALCAYSWHCPQLRWTDGQGTITKIYYQQLAD